MLEVGFPVALDDGGVNRKSILEIAEGSMYSSVLGKLLNGTAGPDAFVQDSIVQDKMILFGLSTKYLDKGKFLFDSCSQFSYK